MRTLKTVMSTAWTTKAEIRSGETRIVVRASVPA
jgi:hypothetical protein